MVEREPEENVARLDAERLFEPDVELGGVLQDAGNDGVEARGGAGDAEVVDEDSRVYVLKNALRCNEVAVADERFF